MKWRAIGLVVLSGLTPGCYLSHGLDAEPRDAGLPRDAGAPRVDASPRVDAETPPSCTIDLDVCVPVHGAPIQLFDAQSQSPELVWGPDRLLLIFWAPGAPGPSGPVLQHLDLEGRVLEEHMLPRGYNTTHLTWNPRIGAGLVSAESMLTWLDASGRPTEEAWISPDERFRGTIDVGPTEDGFAVVVGRRGLETQLGITTAPGEIAWRGISVAAGEPAVADRWDGTLLALSGGHLLRLHPSDWPPPTELVPGDSFQPIDVLALGGSIYTLHAHYDGTDVARRWSADGSVLIHEAPIGAPSGSGSTRLFEVGGRLLAVSTRFAMDAPIVLVELDPVSLEIIAELASIAEPVVGIYNRHSIAMSATPRGLAFVWTEGPIGSGNMRPFLRLYDCCVRD